MKRLILFLFLLISGPSLTQVTAFSENFETANSLTLVNGTQTNKWYWGTTTSGYCNGIKGLNISNNGTTYAYTNTAISVVHAYFNVTIPAGATSVNLNYNCKVNGEASWDDVKIYQAASTFTPTAGTQISGAPTLLATKQGVASCTAQTHALTGAAGATVRIIFQWRNDGSGGTGSAAIDDITVTYVAATIPTCASLSSPTNGATNCPITQTITWAATATATGYDVYFGTSATPPLVSSNQAGTTYNPGTLATNTTYYHKIVPRNGVGPATGCSTWSFTTLNPPANDNCSGATSLPCGTSNLAGTTVNTVSEIAPLGYSSNFGVWYSFVGDGQQTTVSSTAIFDHEMTIMTGSSCGSFGVVSSQDLAVANGTETYTFTTTNGQQYYIYIAYYSTTGTSSNTGTFTINRSCTTAPTPPVNNLCSASTSLPCGTSNLAGTTVNATSKTAPGGGASPYGVWYTFTGDGGQTTVSATGTGGFDLEMTITSGTCASLTVLSSLDATLSNGTETYTFTTVNGTLYYVYVAYWYSAGTSTDVGTFTMSRSCIAPCTTTTTAGTLSVSPSSTGTVNDAFTFTTTGNAGSITKFEWSYNNFATVAGTTNNPANPYSLVMNVYQTQVWVRTTSVNGTCPAGVTTPISVTLQLAPPYVYGTSAGDYISNVTLNTINNNSTYDSPLGDSYQNFTTTATTLVRNVSYTISVSSPVTFAATASGYAAWIDWNNNGTFEVSENIMQQAPASTRSQSFTVPGTSLSGPLKMRVLSTWNATPTTDPYNSGGYNWGEIEEYTINVQSGLPIELMYFEGQPYGDRSNILVWKTATEHNCSHFTIVHSTDGEIWETIDTIEGSDNTTNPVEYQLIHHNVPAVVNYYQLKQYDFDGVYETYGPVAINNMLTTKKIIKLVNSMGQEVQDNIPNLIRGIYFEIYDDGTSKKVYR